LRPLSSAIRASLEQAVSVYEKEIQYAGQYLQGRGISQESCESFRLGYVREPISGHEQYQGCIAIPSIGPGNSVVGLRFRSLGSDGPKYLGLSGAPTRLFNTRAIHEAGDDICITEGEFDSIILTQCGLYSCGVTGVQNWKRHHARMFAGFQKVFIFGDGDKAGQEFSKKVFESLSNGIRVNLSAGKDVNDLWLVNGKASIQSLMEDL
jgi:DNA primase